MKSLKLKNRSNPWITHDILKLMYQRDNAHAKAIQKNDPLLWQNYRELRNKVTCVFKERKKAYFSDINVLCRSDPKGMWSEIKRVVPNKSKHSQHFANIGNNMNSKFQVLSDELFWTVSKSIHTFRFTKVSNKDIENISVPSLRSKTMIFWVWMLYYWGNRSHIFPNH